MRRRLIEDQVAQYGVFPRVVGPRGGWKRPRPNDLDRRPSMVAPGAPPHGSVLDYPSRLVYIDGTSSHDCSRLCRRRFAGSGRFAVKTGASP